jgi:hypothetical protein
MKPDSKQRATMPSGLSTRSTDAAAKESVVTVPAGFFENAPIRLTVAAALYGLTVGALRSEARSGKLTIWRVAGKDWTSRIEIERMFDLCRVQAVEEDCGSEPRAATPDATRPRFGSSETADAKSAQAAALTTTRRLKEGSPPTSSQNTRPFGANVLCPKFGSRT